MCFVFQRLVPDPAKYICRLLTVRIRERFLERNKRNIRLKRCFQRVYFFFLDAHNIIVRTSISCVAEKIMVAISTGKKTKKYIFFHSLIKTKINLKKDSKLKKNILICIYFRWLKKYGNLNFIKNF